MASNFMKQTLASAALWTTLLGVSATGAAEPASDDSMSGAATPSASTLELIGRAWRTRPRGADSATTSSRVRQISASEPLEPGKLVSEAPAPLAAVLPAAPLPAGEPADAAPIEPGASTPGAAAAATASEAEGIQISDLEDGSVEPANFMTPLNQAAKLSCDSSCATCGQSKSCCCCCVCGPPGRFWIRDEYLGFWGKGDHLPALVNTGITGTGPSTITLFGNDSINRGFRSGNWVQAGAWLNDCKSVGIQGDYLFIGRQSTGFYDYSSGTPSLTRPFTNALTGAPGAELVAYPGLLAGGVSVSDYNSFAGAGAAGIRELICTQCCNPCGQNSCYPSCCRLDLIGGFRYYNYNDNLAINENLTATSGALGVPAGTTLNVHDSFRARNNFYGLETGLRGQRYYGRWLFEGSSLVALGENVRQVSIDGSTTVGYPGLPSVTHVGGLYALSSNIGNYRFNNFMAIPQFSGRVGYRVTPRLSLLAGYTFIFWGDVAKAGAQVDTTVNPNLIPPATGGGPARPSFSLNNSSFWVQGFTLGAEYHF